MRRYFKRISPVRKIPGQESCIIVTHTHITALMKPKITPNSAHVPDCSPGLWLAAIEGMEKKMETTIMGDIRTTIRIDSFIPKP